MIKDISYLENNIIDVYLAASDINKLERLWFEYTSILSLFNTCMKNSDEFSVDSVRKLTDIYTEKFILLDRYKEKITKEIVETIKESDIEHYTWVADFAQAKLVLTKNKSDNSCCLCKN